MKSNFYLFCLLLYVFCQLEMNTTERVTYIATERPKVVYFNKKFIRNVSLTSHRYSRDDPVYYINMYTESLVTFGNNVSVDLYFYEYQGNRYIRTFVELHFKMCDFIENSNLFGDSLKTVNSNYSCPFQPGQYNYPNLTIPLQSIPKNFPFKQGRLMGNSSLNHNGATSRLLEAYIELEVKTARRNNSFKRDKG